MIHLRLTAEIDEEVAGPIPFPIAESRSTVRQAGMTSAVRRVESAIDRVSRQLAELEEMLEPLPFRPFARDDEGPRAA